MTTSPLTGRFAVVTGASRGIGYVLSQALATAGAHVIGVARSGEGLASLTDQIRSKGGAATAVPLDLRENEAPDKLAVWIDRQFGRLDMLLGNAGLLGPIAPVVDIEPKAWNDVLAVNVTANLGLMRALTPLLLRSDAGRLLFVSAGIPRQLAANWATYAVSKIALEALVRTYALETKGSSLRVNLFNPGPIGIGMRLEAMPDDDPSLLPPPEALVPDVMRMLAPDFDQHGTLFDFPTRSILQFGD